MQWRIQDFPDGWEAPTPDFGAKTYYCIWQGFCRNLLKMKVIGPGARGINSAFLDPPMYCYTYFELNTR